MNIKKCFNNFFTDHNQQSNKYNVLLSLLSAIVLLIVSSEVFFSISNERTFQYPFVEGFSISIKFLSIFLIFSSVFIFTSALLGACTQYRLDLIGIKNLLIYLALIYFVDNYGDIVYEYSYKNPENAIGFIFGIIAFKFMFGGIFLNCVEVNRASECNAVYGIREYRSKDLIEGTSDTSSADKNN